MDSLRPACEYRNAGCQVRKVGGGGAAWYASKEAVGLGRDASPSSDDSSFLLQISRGVISFDSGRLNGHRLYNAVVRRRSRDKNTPHSKSASSSKKSDRRVGLARALSKLGLCSRSQACAWIAAGRVRLVGAITRNPEAPVRMGIDRVEIDGQTAAAADKVYLVVNKERGVVTTASDEHGRATVYDSLPEPPSGHGADWVAPVGRLDKASEGLLLMTNDSEWAARITAPESHLDKTYHVQIARVADEGVLEKLRRGIETRGETLAVKRAALLRSGGKNSWIEMVLDEGKNRQVRRMLESLGIEVLRLIRVSIGPLALGDLQRGAVRSLTLSEKALLDRALAEHADSRQKHRTSR
jgi:23S rRNA pseudouridine2605 synthase